MRIPDFLHFGLYFSSVSFLLYFHFFFSISQSHIIGAAASKHFMFPSDEELTLETLDFAFCDRQYANLFIFRCVSEHCLRRTLSVNFTAIPCGRTGSGQISTSNVKQLVTWMFAVSAWTLIGSSFSLHLWIISVSDSG